MVYRSNDYGGDLISTTSPWPSLGLQWTRAQYVAAVNYNFFVWGAPAISKSDSEYCMTFIAYHNQLVSTVSYDGGVNWSTPYVFPGQFSKATPAMVNFRGGSNFSIFYIANNSSNQLLRTSTFAAGWGLWWQIPGQSSKATPAVALVPGGGPWGTIYMAYIANDPSNRLIVTSSRDEENWTSPYAIPGQSSKAAPALAYSQYTGRLYMAYIANDSSNTLYVTSTSNGVNWTPSCAIPGQSSKAAPTLVATENGLVMVYLCNDTSNRLLVTRAVFSTPTSVLSGSSWSWCQEIK